jgi:hypothetical protein
MKRNKPEGKWKRFWSVCIFNMPKEEHVQTEVLRWLPLAHPEN